MKGFIICNSDLGSEFRHCCLLICQEDNAGHVNDNGDESCKLDGKGSEFANGGVENVMQIESDVSDWFINF